MRTPLAALPYWPRYLTREEAGRYLGVSATVFDDEVKSGAWPSGRPRGAKGGRLTWDREVLDAAADRYAGLAEPPAAVVQTIVAAEADAWGARINGAAKNKPAQRRTQKAA